MITTATVTEQYVMDILSQESAGAKFPINFDDVWQSAGYTAKRSAVRFLTERCNAVEGVDYIVLTERCQTPQGGRSSDSIRLSSDGYEFFLSRSHTPQGDSNLRRLIQIKRAYIKQLELLAATPQDTTELNVLKAENKRLKKESIDYVHSVLKDTEKTIKTLENVAKENKSLRIELEEEKDAKKYFFEKVEKLEVPLRKAQKEIERLTKDFTEACKYLEYYKNECNTYEQVVVEALEHVKRFKAENEKLKADLALEEVSSDIKVRRVYWAELITTYTENKRLREQLGMPPKTVNQSKPKGFKK